MKNRNFWGEYYSTLENLQCFELLQENIMERLENLEKTAIRSEFKLEIYQIYLLPSIRFLLTVHDLPISLLSKLDTMADQYLKKWAGLPKCATNAILHLNTALDIKKISTLYKEVHATSHCSTRLKGDTGVNLAIDNRLARESKLIRKQSINRPIRADLQAGFWSQHSTG